MIDIRLHLRVILTVLVAIGTVFLCPAQVVTPAPDRGVTLEPEKTVATAPGHRYIVSIGINDYDHWPKLATAVNDATGFAQLLKMQFGFEDAAPPLTNAAAKREAIVSLIDDDLRGKLKPEDDLIVFFAGHGTTRTDTVGTSVTKTGYLVPYEAHAPGVGERWSEYINVDDFLRMVSTLPANHVLVILDSCHSGMALGSGFSSSRGLEHLTADMSRKIGRKVISSAQGDQLAADRGPLPGHSLFTGLMMQGLTNGKADNFGQGYVTSSQLGAFVQHEVSVAEGSTQTPLFGGFYRDDAGELILPTLSNTSFAELFTKASEAWSKGAYTNFATLAEQAVRINPNALESLWLNAKISTMKGDDASAEKDMQLLAKRLETEDFSVKDIPVDSEALMKLSLQKAWQQMLTVLQANAGTVRFMSSQGDYMQDRSGREEIKDGETVTINKKFVVFSLVNTSSDPFFANLLLIGRDGSAESISDNQSASENQSGIPVLPGIERVLGDPLRSDGKDDTTQFVLILSPTHLSDLLRGVRRFSPNQMQEYFQAHGISAIRFKMHTVPFK